MFFSHDDYHKEVLRKLIHLSSLWIPVMYYFLPKPSMLLLLGVVTLGIVTLDIGRIFVPRLRRFTRGVVGRIMRTHELENRLSGSSYFLLGAFLTVMLFAKDIAITALLVLIISDASASLIGKRFGKRRLLTKTWEGTLAFMVSGWIMVVISAMVFCAPVMFFMAGMIAVAVGAYVELISGTLKLDDNLTIPLSVASVMATIHALIS